MRVPTPRIALPAVAVAAAALTLGVAVTANAAPGIRTDTAARPGDVVGVGSDTLQNAADFILDQTGNGVAGGYNNIGNVNRVFNVYATGDANGRATYDGTCSVPQPSASASAAPTIPTICSTTNPGNPDPLVGTVVLRGGDNPVVRPNGSGNGIAALELDASGQAGYQGLPTGSIQFARASRLPNSTEIGNCSTSSACGGLHVYQFATDQLAIAHLTAGYDGPAGGLTVAQLVQIYECNDTTWKSVGGTSTATIHPLIPQSGSGTRNFFLADLQAANGGTAITLGGCVRTVQEHDPDGIYQDSSSADAIEPFSVGKLSLINSGYFANGGAAFAKNLLTYDQGDGTSATAYDSTRGLYFVVRNADLGSSTPFQTGSSQNFVQALFAGPTSYIARSAQAAAIKAAGFTQAYKDCGINPGSC